MARQPKVSVIVTTYNSEETLERCLQSAVHQTIDSMELIIVDDKSSDSTVQIAQNYIQKYGFIKLLQNDKNMGPGFSKNRGLKAATGLFVGFLDSDDYVDENYYKRLYKAAEKFGTNIACADIALKYPTKTSPTDLLTGNTYLDLNKIEIVKADGAQLIPSQYAASHWTGASACTKIFKRTAFGDLLFFEGRCCDDLAYALPALAMEKKIAYVRGLYYYYVQREGSTENRHYDEIRQDVAHAISETFSVFEKIEDCDENKKLLIMNSGIVTLRKLLMYSEDSRRLQNIKDYFNNLSKQASYYFSIETNPYIKMLLNTYYKSGERIFFEKAIRLFSQGECKLVDDLYTKWIDNPIAFYPKVSIIIPVYNGSNYMCEAIGSALSQTYPNIEVIVVNDGSTDNGMTDSIAKSYGDRIRYFKKENGGVATALNLGIEKMEGEYFAWLSHDDVYENNKISHEIEVVSCLEDKTTFLVGGYTVINEHGKRMFDVNLLKQYSREELSRPLFAVFRGGINGCATLIHKSHFERVGVFNPDLPTTQDYDLWFRILRGQKLHYYNACNVKSRAHEDQGSRKAIDAHIIECTNLWVNMMSSLTDDERTAIDGSPLLFYIKTADFLENATGYKDALAYARQQVVNITSKEFRIQLDKGQKTDDAVNDIRAAIDGTMKYTDLKQILAIPYVKPRITFLLGEFWDGGGLTKVTMSLANLLSNRFDVFLIGDNKKHRFAYQPSEAIKIVDLSTTYYSPEIISRLLQFIRTDVFVMGFNCQKPLLSLYGTCRKIGIKTIAWNHEFYYMPYLQEKPSDCVPVKNSAQADADLVIWANSFSAGIYGLLQNNSVVIANPLTMVPPKQTSKEHSKNIIAVGRFDDPNKNLKALLTVFKQINEKRPDTHLYILGSYDLYQDLPDRPGYTYKKFIKELKIPLHCLHFVGWVNDPGLYYKNAAVQLFTSYFEGFGLVITEAAACGVPSIVFSGSGFEDIISDGVDGYIVERDNFELMAERAIELLDRKDKWQQFSWAAVQMSQRYSPDNILSKWHNLLNALLQDRLPEFVEKFNLENSPRVNDGLFIKQVVENYENCIREMYKLLEEAKKQQQYSKSEPENEMQPYISDFYRNEYEKMLNTLSWRITKPVRMVRTVQRSCKQHGIKATIGKVYKKLKRK